MKLRKKEKEEARGVPVSREWGRDSIFFFFFFRTRVCWMHLALMIQSDQSYTFSLSLSPPTPRCTISSSSHTILSRFLSLPLRFCYSFFLLLLSVTRRVILIASAISRIRLSGHIRRPLHFNVSSSVFTLHHPLYIP